MEEQRLRRQMMQYNRLYKEMEDVYHSLANHYGMSDTALWLLYILRESESSLTQSEISEKLSLRKQTIHSALKNLEKAGYLVLESPTGSQKNKQIHLTETGESLALQTVDHVLAMERNALRQLTEGERALFLQLNQTYAALLRQEAEKLLKAKQ